MNGFGKVGKGNLIKLGGLVLLISGIVVVFKLTPLSPSGFTPTNVKSFILRFGVWAPIVFVLVYSMRAVILVLPVGIAIGIRANVEFLEGSGIEVDRAVLVDEKLQTNVEGVYAAGDVCAAYDPSGDRYRPTRTWLPCALQGETAALNMLGYGETYHEGVFFNASHAYHSMYALLGRFDSAPSEGYEFLICSQDENNYEKLVLKDDKIVGAIFIGSMKNVWPVKQLIEAQADISSVRDQLCGGTDLQLLLPDEYSILF